jgi:hypothetical protein
MQIGKFVMAWLLPVSAFSSWSRLELATAWHRTLRLQALPRVKQAKALAF